MPSDNHPTLSPFQLFFKFVGIGIIACLLVLFLWVITRVVFIQKSAPAMAPPTTVITPAGVIEPSPPLTPEISEQVARNIATNENSLCQTTGTVGATEGYNSNSQTWWFSLTPFQPKAGCKPACVVAVSDTSQGSLANPATNPTINWRCTGLKPVQP